ncbi:fimbrial protein [Klebsiella pneumoniae]|uniref:fimbrial protein n=1 Tax=Klebsiella pneumoniae TaxID=573 RepID=UPI002DBBE182|nr:fimbrial protein [Klebsiella pneumoniae]MEC4509552.1 fimbrial protein [Klebsiella pneumoniae]HDO6739764.1 fimbrial protein [Klebsiella pneumoniae]
MQGVKTGLLTLLLPFASLADTHWAVAEGLGNMRFQGEIIAESCRVDAENQQLIIHMGRVSSNRFHTAGEMADAVPFEIHLSDCNTLVRQQIGISFRGVVDDKNPEVLSVGEGSGIATGVGIALFDNNNQLIHLNSPAFKLRQLPTGANTLNFVARYKAISNQVTGGTANAQVWFSLTYQ